MSRYVCHRKRKALKNRQKLLFPFYFTRGISSFSALNLVGLTHDTRKYILVRFYLPTICLSALKYHRTCINPKKNSVIFFHSLFLFDKLFFTPSQPPEAHIFSLFLLRIFMIRVLCWIHKHRRAYQNIFPAVFLCFPHPSWRKFMNFYACFLMLLTYVATLSMYQMLSLFPLTSHFKTFIHRLITFTSQVRWIWNISTLFSFRDRKGKKFPQFYMPICWWFWCLRVFFCGLFFLSWISQ